MRGTKPEWANLPRRKCDDCGTSYKLKRPLRKGERGFCSATCRKSYHKHGGAYRKLKAEIQKMLAHEVKQHLDAIGALQAEVRELRQLWSETESRVVSMATRRNAAH